MTIPPALARFLEEQLPPSLGLLRRMVEINSYTGNRDGVNRLGQLTADCFAGLGFSAEFVPSANPLWGDHLVLTRRGRSARNVALVSHLDTVFPPEEEIRNHFHWLPEGDRIYGPGTHDIKGGTVMMHLVLSALRSFAPSIFEETTWLLLLNSSEEVLSQDFGEVCLKRFTPQTLAALVFESEGRRAEVTRLVLARKGRGTFRITVSGRAAHAGTRHRRGANALVQMSRTIQQVAALTDHERELTFNVGTLGGGVAVNRVPHEAVADVEMRAFAPATYEQGKAAILALNGPGEVRSLEDGYACVVRVEVLTESSPWPRNSGTERLFALWQQTGAELGMAIEGEERGGLSDGNLLWQAVPTLDGLGPFGDNDHSSERSADGSKLPEYVDVSSFIPKAALNTMAVIRLAGGQPDPG